MRRYTVTVNGTEHVIDVDELTADTFQVKIDAQSIEVRLADHADLAQAAITPIVEPRSVTQPRAIDTPTAAPAAPPRASARPASPSAPVGANSDAAHIMTAPMPGVVLSIDASVGATVHRGDPLLVLEAMKMKNALGAPRDGIVAEIMTEVGQQVKYGDALVRFEEMA